MIKKEYIFPVILIALDIGGGIVYGAAEDYKKLVYWLALFVVQKLRRDIIADEIQVA